MAVVGEAKVVIRALGNKLESDIQKALDRAGAKAGASGDKAGKKYSEAITDAVEKNIADVDEPIKEALSNAGDAGGKEGGRRAARGIRDGLDASIPQIEATGDRIGRRVGDRVSRGFERSRFVRVMGSALVKLGIFIPIIGALVGGISALISGLFALVAVVGTASASLVALGGVLSAGIGAIGVFVIAMKGVGKAISAGFSDDPEKFAEALEKVAPAARPFVKEFVSLKDTFVGLRDAAAEGLFPGLESALGRLAPVLPRMADGLRGTGEAAGQAVDNFFRLTAGSDTFRANLESLGRNNEPVIRGLGSAFGDVTAAVVALLDAAGPLTQRFTNWITDGAESLRNMTEEGNRSGALAGYLKKAGDAAAQLGRIFGNIFEGLYEIGQIAAPVGGDLLDSFEGATEKLAEFTDKAENVTKAKQYFEDIGVNVKAIGDLVNAVGAAFIRMGAAPGVAKTADALTKIVPELEEALTASIESIGPAIVELVGKILELFTVLEESGAVKSVIEIFTQLATALTFVFNIPGIGRGLLYLLQFVAVMKALKLVMKGGGFFFNSVRDGIAGVTSASEKAATRSMAGVSGFLKFRDSLRDVGNLSPRVSSAVTGTGLAVDSLATKAGLSDKSVMRLTQTATTAGTVLGNAATKARAFAGNAVRAGGGVALLAAGASGAAGAVGLQNTAMLAGAGLMVGGPWGAAIGAGIGLVVDFATYSDGAADAIRGLNAALKTTDVNALSQAAAAGTKSLSAFDDMTNQSGVGDFVSDILPNMKAGFQDLFRGDFSGSQRIREMEELRDKTSQARAEIERINNINTSFQLRIDLQNAMDAIKPFKEEMKRLGEPVSLKFGDTGAAQAQSILLNLSNSLTTVRKKFGETSPEFEQGRKALTNFLKSANLSPAAVDLLSDSLAGLPPKFDQIPDDKKVKFTADELELMEALGLSKEAVEGLQDSHNTVLSATKDGNFDPMIDTVLDSLLFVGKGATAKVGVQADLAALTTFGTTIDALTAPQLLSIKTSIDPKARINVDNLSKSVRNLPAVKKATVNGKISGKDLVDALDRSIRKVPPTKNPKVTATAKGKTDIDKLKKAAEDADKDRSFSVRGVISLTKSVGKGITTKLLNAVGLAGGGLVTGPGTGVSDSIPAMLSNGEYVIRASQVKKFKPLLDRINDNKPIPKNLPDMGRSSNAATSRPRSGASALRIASGTVTLTPDSRALLHLAAEEVYDDSRNHDNVVGNM